MKTRMAILIASAGLLTGTGAARAATYYVRTGGSDRADGLSARTAFGTINRAAQVLNHGDHVVIGPGLYRDNAFFAERFGADGSDMTVAGDESGQLTGDAAGPVFIEPASLAEPALRFHRFRRLVVSGLTFRGPGDGLAVESSLRIAVRRCSFLGLRRGFIGKSIDGLHIESSVFARCAVGASLQGSVACRLAQATFANNASVALLVLGCGPGSIRNAIFAANNSNLMLDKVSAPSWSSDHNVIHGTSGPWGTVPMVYAMHEWSSASGQDRHSVHVIPAFADIARDDYHLDAQVTWGGGLPGMNVGGSLDPAVPLDRDGKPFRKRGSAVSAGAYDYPDPLPAAGWAPLPVEAIAASGSPRVSAGIYTADGTLVRMLVSDAAGIPALWWDGLDDIGRAAPAGPYEVRVATHDLRLLDDGNMGDNGSPLGTYHCDNPQRVVVLRDGRFLVTTTYDEAGIPIRLYSASGKSVAGVNLAAKDVWGIATSGGGFIAGIGGDLMRLVLPGDRAPMANGAASYPILADGERLPDKTKPAGLAVVGGAACVALPGLDVIRVIDLANGRRRADWPMPAVADLATDAEGILWVLSGKDVLALGANGRPVRRFPAGVEAPRYLAAGGGRLAVIDSANSRIALLQSADGKVVRVFGRPPDEKAWLPVRGDVFLGLRGAAFLPDGRLLITESGRTRAIWPDTGEESFVMESNFMDVAVPHPQKPEYVYCHRASVFHVDTKTGAWRRIAEAPSKGVHDKVSTSVILGGRPFIVAFSPGVNRVEEADGEKKTTSFSSIQFVDVSDPAQPRLAAEIERRPTWTYTTVAFTRAGDLVLRGPAKGGGYSLTFSIAPFLGLDAKGNPSFDLEKTRGIGPDPDPSPRAMGHTGGFAVDPSTDDVYYMAVTAQHNKMVPAWGASATGVGRSKADGTPLWFSLSSGGNYTSMDCLHDGARTWIVAGKDFGGQVDVYDADGLRLTTGAWSWPCNWTMGFVDLRFAVQAYLRPDGAVGVYVEDDNIGRFVRARLEGAATLRKASLPFAWNGQAATPGPAPVPDRVGAAQAAQPPLTLKKVSPLPLDGDWSAWAQAGVVPQVVSFPAVTWGRNWPDDLFQSFRAGTSIGAFAHDGTNLYAYFVTTDDTPHFDADKGGMMWSGDGIELWIEEEQIGLGFVKSGQPALFKYRYHNREGREWAANYPLPDANVWGQALPSLDRHPLGRQLAESVGVSFEGRMGYALMAKIPLEEIKLVGGIAGRGGKDILPATGRPGEILRIGVAFDGINAWGREQDFKVYWPIGLMFSDPSRNVPFVFGE